MHTLQRWMTAFGTTARLLAVGTALAWAVVSPGVSHAADAKEIDAEVDLTLREFTEKITGSDEFLKHAKGVLVFPAIYKAGFIFGAEYGSGALRVNGKTVDYYNLVGITFGLQAGVQQTSLILMFMKDEALAKFQNSSGFELGGEAGATLVAVGGQLSLDTTKLGQPVLAVAFDQRGLMVDLVVQGSKFTKLDLK